MKPAVVCLLALFAATPACAQTKWVAAWGAAPEHAWTTDADHPARHDTTLRMVIAPDQIGRVARFHLSNLLGTAPLTIDDASVAFALPGTAANAALVPHSGHAIAFKGKKNLTLAPGEEAWSDPVPLNFIGLPTDARILGHALAVSLHLPGALGPLTWEAGGASFASEPGASQAATEAETPFTTRLGGTLVLDAMDIMAPARTQVMVVLGERFGDADDGWTRMLARRIHAVNADRATLVDLTRDDARATGLAQQLDRDLPSGTSTILLLVGLADVSAGGATPEATAEALGILARRTRARMPGVKLLGATLPPAPPGGLPADKDRSRRDLDQFIRLTDVFDGVVDLDGALADPATGFLRAGFVQKGSLVPNYAGQLAMSEAVDMKLAIKPPPAPPAPRPEAGEDTAAPTN